MSRRSGALGDASSPSHERHHLSANAAQSSTQPDEGERYGQLHWHDDLSQPAAAALANPLGASRGQGEGGQMQDWVHAPLGAVGDMAGLHSLYQLPQGFQSMPDPRLQAAGPAFNPHSDPLGNAQAPPSFREAPMPHSFPGATYAHMSVPSHLNSEAQGMQYGLQSSLMQDMMYALQQQTQNQRPMQHARQQRARRSDAPMTRFGPPVPMHRSMAAAPPPGYDLGPLAQSGYLAPHGSQGVPIVNDLRSCVPITAFACTPSFGT